MVQTCVTTSTWSVERIAEEFSRRNMRRKEGRAKWIRQVLTMQQEKQGGDNNCHSWQTKDFPKLNDNVPSFFFFFFFFPSSLAGADDWGWSGERRRWGPTVWNERRASQDWQIQVSDVLNPQRLSGWATVSLTQSAQPEHDSLLATGVPIG